VQGNNSLNKVTIRTGSIDALETFKANLDGFDLIITDMTMPDMTGTQLASEIKSIRADIPIIICTGFSDRINEETSSEFDIQAFITKPVIQKEMAQIIRDVLDKPDG
jgi:two-component system cell cycle sensor histidine kinase/response regulator CckA